MKKSIFPALLLAWTISQAVAVPEAYEINPENSSVLFKVRLLWTTNIEGCFCGGVSGRVSFDPDAPQKSTVKLEIKKQVRSARIFRGHQNICSLNIDNFYPPSKPHPVLPTSSSTDFSQ